MRNLLSKLAVVFRRLCTNHLPEHVVGKMSSLVETFLEVKEAHERIRKKLIVDRENRRKVEKEIEMEEAKMGEFMDDWKNTTSSGRTKSKEDDNLDVFEDDTVNILIGEFVKLGEQYRHTCDYHRYFGLFYEKVCCQNEEAKIHFQMATEANRNSADSWYCLGRLLLKMTCGCNEALKCFKKVVKLRPGHKSRETRLYRLGEKEAQKAETDSYGARLMWAANRSQQDNKQNLEEWDLDDFKTKREVFALLIRKKMLELLKEEDAEKFVYQGKKFDLDEINFILPIHNRESVIQFVVECQSVNTLEMFHTQHGYIPEYFLSDYINGLATKSKKLDAWKRFEISVALEICFVQILGLYDHSGENYLIAPTGEYIRILNENLFTDSFGCIPAYVMTACLRNWETEIRTLAVLFWKFIMDRRIDLKLFALGVMSGLDMDNDNNEVAHRFESWLDNINSKEGFNKFLNWTEKVEIYHRPKRYSSKSVSPEATERFYENVI